MTLWSFARELLTVAVAFGAAWVGAQISNIGAARRDEAGRKRDEADARVKLTTALRLLLEEVAHIHGLGDNNAGVLSLLERRAAHYTQLMLDIRLSGFSQQQIDYLTNIAMRADILAPFLSTCLNSTADSQRNIAASCHDIAQLIPTALKGLGYNGDLTKSISGAPFTIVPGPCPLCLKLKP